MPEDIVAQEAEKQARQSTFKRFLIIPAIVLALVAVFAGAYFVIKNLPGKQAPEEKPKEEKKEVASISAETVASYKISTPQADSGTFIYTGPQTMGVFTPLTAYFLNENKLSAMPFNVSATNTPGKPWCFGEGTNATTLSQNQLAYYCLEDTGNKKIILRHLDLIGREYKEFTFSGDSGIFSDGRQSQVVSSRDGDSAFIYSPSGSFMFEETTSSLYKLDLPSNLEITKVVHISNTETALITRDSHIYRINFSSHKGGIFGVNFIGFAPEQLSKGLSTTRLSKDGRRLVFTISDLFENMPADQRIDYPSIKTYNIDLSSAKVSDELNNEERFLVACRNLVGDKYCLLKKEAENPGVGMEETLYSMEFDQPPVEITRTRLLPNAKIATLSVNGAQGYFFVRAPRYFDKENLSNVTWVNYVYKTSTKTLTQLY